MIPFQSNVGTLKLSGYIRGQALNVNSLVHLPGWGDFQMKQIDAPADPYPLQIKERKNKVRELFLNNFPGTSVMSRLSGLGFAIYWVFRCSKQFRLYLGLYLVHVTKVRQFVWLFGFFRGMLLKAIHITTKKASILNFTNS